MSFSPNSTQNEMHAWPPIDIGGAWQHSLFYARAYGNELSDIDLNLSLKDIPYAVTQLLHSCLVDLNGQRFDIDDIWNWNVKRRLQGLLAIVTATMGERYELTTSCRQPTCNEKLEIELSLHDFVDADEVHDIHCEPESGILLGLRLPTGRDQSEWRKYATGGDFSEALQIMSRAVITHCNGEQLPDDFLCPDNWFSEVDSVLEEADSMTALTLLANCPTCGANSEIELDLEPGIIRLLSNRRVQQMENIHLIASTYHWTEDEIMRLSPSRRDFYIKRIVGEDG